MKTNISALLLVLLVCFFHSEMTSAQCGKFEPPPGKALLIVGQDLDAVGGLSNRTNGYIEKVIGSNTGIFPAGVTTYTDLTYNLGLYNETDYGAGPLRVQSYVEDGDFNNSVIAIGLDLQSGQLDNAANGNLDGNINNLINWINSQNPRPIFLRIGYEFNAQHNAYNGATFIKAWKRIVDKFRSANVSNVAFVWQADDSQMAENNLAAWYPGDSYVDWVGYSRFLGNGGGMISFARNHKKPCMIAEATPQGHHTASENGSTLWNQWYAPLFAQIHSNNDVIKALCYINQNWDAQPIWQGTFGDSRIQGNATLLANWLTEIKTSFWMHSSATLFSDLKTGCSGGVVADFVASATRMYSGQSISFTNRSSGNITSYSWDFGSGASPATSSVAGPVKVTYSTSGLKTIKLTVSGPGGLTNTITKTSYINVEEVPSSACMLVDDFTAAASVSKFAGAPNAFTHSQKGSDWIVTSNGHGEWDSWDYKFNDGSTTKAFNFSHPSLTKPTITLKVKKKPSTPGTHSNALLKVDMFDQVSATDGIYTTNKIVLTESYQTITIDMSGKLFNKYGCSLAGCGILDSTNIIGLRFSVNPGYSSFPVTMSGTKFNDYFAGEVDIDIISIGTGCGNVIISDFSADKLSVEPGQTVVYNATPTGTVTGYSWNFGSGASPATSTSAGPVSVTYSSQGLKTVSLTVTGPSGSDTKTKTSYLNVAAKTSNCSGFYYDLFSDNKVSAFSTSDPGGVFTFGEANNYETVTSAGHGEWDFVALVANDGTIASPVDITAKQKLYIKIKASKAIGMRISLMDANGVEAGNNSLPAVSDKDITTDWQTFAIDYTGKLSGDWFGKGALDKTKIAKIILRPNAGFKSSPIKPAYNSTFTGTIDIDYIVLGDTLGCFGSIVTGIKDIQSAETSVSPNPFKDEVNLYVSSAAPQSQIVVFNIFGQEVYNEIKSTNENILIGKEFKNGLYIIKILSGNKVTTHKIIKSE